MCEDLTQGLEFVESGTWCNKKNEKDNMGLMAEMFLDNAESELTHVCDSVEVQFCALCLFKENQAIPSINPTTFIKGCDVLVIFFDSYLAQFPTD